MQSLVEIISLGVARCGAGLLPQLGERRKPGRPLAGFGLGAAGKPVIEREA